MLDRMAQLNGRPVTTQELQTLALTNYGHFTSFRVEQGRVRGFTQHLDRLARDSQTLFDFELDRDHVRHLVRLAVPSTGASTMRVTVFDPATDLGRPVDATNPQILITHRPAGNLPLPALRVQTVRYQRDLPQVKSVALFGTLRCRRAAQQAGFDDALFLDADGYISEGGTWNIGLHDGATVIWPDAAYLPGITMEILRAATPSETRVVQTAGLTGVRAVFATNAAIGVREITAVDGVELPRDPRLLESLRSAYVHAEPELV